MSDGVLRGRCSRWQYSTNSRSPRTFQAMVASDRPQPMRQRTHRFIRSRSQRWSQKEKEMTAMDPRAPRLRPGRQIEQRPAGMANLTKVHLDRVASAPTILKPSPVTVTERPVRQARKRAAVHRAAARRLRRHEPKRHRRSRAVDVEIPPPGGAPPAKVVRATQLPLIGRARAPGHPAGHQVAQVAQDLRPAPIRRQGKPPPQRDVAPKAQTAVLAVVSPADTVSAPPRIGAAIGCADRIDQPGLRFRHDQLRAELRAHRVGHKLGPALARRLLAG